MTITPEERSQKKAARLAANLAAQKRRDEEEAAERADLLKTLPKRLMDAQALANSLGVRVSVNLSETGPIVHFGEYDGPGDIDTELTYQSDCWEIEWLEKRLQYLKEEQAARAARLRLAKDTWGNLKQEEKDAIKEFIHSL